MVKDDKSRKKRYKSYLKSELEAAALYSALANVEKDVERREIFLELVGQFANFPFLPVLRSYIYIYIYIFRYYIILYYIIL